MRAEGWGRVDLCTVCTSRWERESTRATHLHLVVPVRGVGQEERPGTDERERRKTLQSLLLPLLFRLWHPLSLLDHLVDRDAQADKGQPRPGPREKRALVGEMVSRRRPRIFHTERCQLSRQHRLDGFALIAAARRGATAGRGAGPPLLQSSSSPSRRRYRCPQTVLKELTTGSLQHRN